ncbi:MAG TPA: hypothetical protein VNM92_18515 [Thermoanaerobaculia bacterium]|nr:hypothetical protein [Thermoanaerobaculia bacterium]
MRFIKAILNVSIYSLVAFHALSASAQAVADPALVEWKKKVTEAKALTDEAKMHEAMLALVREALRSSEVRPSGTQHSDQVHPEDNQPAPVVNFDARLNQKTTYASSGTRLEGPAYYFLAQGKPYVVLGPRALDSRSPVFTRLSAAHELFHAKNHVGDPRPISDRELETWTHVFVTLFQEVYPLKQRWAPLVSFYEAADPGERKAALDKLVHYYRTPPSTAGDDKGQARLRVAFEEWLGRRRKDTATASSRLVADLDKAIAKSPASQSP